jgi:hypothetical protein
MKNNQKQKIDFKTILIIGLIIVILLLRFCGDGKTDINKGDIIKVKGKKYELVDHKKDTTYITRDSIVYRKGKDIKVEVKVPVYIPQEADTILILKDYFSKRFYIDTLDLGQSSFVIIKDTITENKIYARMFESSITERIINDTLFLKEPPKRKFFIGLQGGFDRTDIVNYGGINLLYNDKNDKLYGLGLGINSNRQPTLMGSVYWKIKFKK